MKSGIKGNVETLSLSFKYVNQGKDLSMLEYLSKIHKVQVLYKTKQNLNAPSNIIQKRCLGKL